ncbi:hypothetical protein [Bradyrhizobium liaoningense]|uniref:hypothetical protein n=1 Tax=Bradyrhizobium liaoningense TaxID=43992 RepID=UPI001BAE11DA|nr:hypothetical protein [Bradyrhizobium liaoningense]MBR1168002.1 hypothetical protein [Bradyrhizobium liaoningense]
MTQIANIRTLPRFSPSRPTGVSIMTAVSVEEAVERLIEFGRHAVATRCERLPSAHHRSHNANSSDKDPGRTLTDQYTEQAIQHRPCVLLVSVDDNATLQISRS